MRALRSTTVAMALGAALLLGPASQATAAPAANAASVSVQSGLVAPLVSSGPHVFGTRAECEAYRATRQRMGNPTSDCTYWTFAGVVYYWALFVF